MNHFYEILNFIVALRIREKELALPLVSDYFPEELKILKKYNEYAFTVAIFEKLEEVFHVHFLIEDVLFYQFRFCVQSLLEYQM